MMKARNHMNSIAKIKDEHLMLIGSLVESLQFKTEEKTQGVMIKMLNTQHQSFGFQKSSKEMNIQSSTMKSMTTCRSSQLLVPIFVNILVTIKWIINLSKIEFLEVVINKDDSSRRILTVSKIIEVITIGEVTDITKTTATTAQLNGKVTEIASSQSTEMWPKTHLMMNSEGSSNATVPKNH